MLYCHLVAIAPGISRSPPGANVLVLGDESGCASVRLRRPQGPPERPVPASLDGNQHTQQDVPQECGLVVGETL